MLYVIWGKSRCFVHLRTNWWYVLRWIEGLPIKAPYTGPAHGWRLSIVTRPQKSQEQRLWRSRKLAVIKINYCTTSAHTQAPASTTDSWPQAHATCSGVFPDKLVASTGDRALRSRRLALCLTAGAAGEKQETILPKCSKVVKCSFH